MTTAPLGSETGGATAVAVLGARIVSTHYATGPQTSPHCCLLSSSFLGVVSEEVLSEGSPCETCPYSSIQVLVMRAIVDPSTSGGVRLHPSRAPAVPQHCPNSGIKLVGITVKGPWHYVTWLLS